MIKFSGLSLLAGAAVALGVSIGGCSSSSNNSSSGPLSAAGESCSRTADCGSGLVCVENTCVAKGTTTINDAGVVIGADGGVVVVDSGTVVPEAAPPRLSAIGESCLTAADCAQGLTCIPSSPYGGGGICDVSSFGLTPTGKSCTGECNAPADCCELPLNSSVNGTPVHNCQDILTVVLNNDTSACAASPAPASSIGVGCFLYSTYCAQNCSTNWSCTANQCSYKGTCSNSGVAFNGCPAVTRTGHGLPSTCNTQSNTCAAPTTVGVCNADTDCEGKATNDTGITCHGNNCTCFKQGCYVKCGSDLDCHTGYSCNTTTKLCTENAACSTDADCALSTNVSNAKCSMGTCKVPCTNDHQCSGSGQVNNNYLSGFGGQVCGSDGFCAELGCSSDADCQNAGTPGTVHFLCVTPTTTPAVPGVQSAITN
jgi:hypothetical protein